jgi:UDP-glucose 4-epimerase
MVQCLLLHFPMKEKINEMRMILITGGAGYVGSHTIRYLLERGLNPDKILVFDNLSKGHQNFIPPGVTFHKGDLLNPPEIDRVFTSHSIDGVLHFAAQAYVGESMVQPGKYFENNVSGGINLLQCMVKHDCRKIVFSSSCAVYGNVGAIALSEKMPEKPINPYGESKRIFESILEWYFRIHGIRSISLRYFNAAGAAYGIGERHRPETHLIPLLIHAAMGLNQSFHIFGDNYDTPDGTCIRDFTHVADLARAHWDALAFLHRHDVCEVVNLGSGIGKSIRELLNIIQDLSRKPIPFKMAPPRPGDPPVLIAENEKAAQMLNWKPQKSLADMLESAWYWHQQDCENCI